MAPNKFATMLNRKTNRITLVLVYALLEWALIFLLLLNSLFSYLIVKFANYFGLKLPCLLCSRIDHVLEPENSKSSYRDLICEHHAIELSRSGYCFHHRKLVESQDMCEDCWSSHQGNPRHPSAVLAFRWLKEIGMVKSDGDCEVIENCDLNLRCSCCGVAIKSEIQPPHAVIKTSSAVLEDATQMENINELPQDAGFDGEPDRNGTDSLSIDGKDKEEVARSRGMQIGPHSDIGKGDDSSESFSFWLSKEGYSLIEAEEAEGDEVLEAETEPLLKDSAASVTDSYADERIIPPQHLEFYIDLDDYQLIPVESADSDTAKSKGESKDGGVGDRKRSDQETANELWRVTDEELVLEHAITVAPAALDVVEKLNSSSLDSFALDETESEDLPTKQGQELEIKSEIEELVLEHDITGTPAAPDAVESFNTSSLDSLELGETKIEDFPTKQGQEQEIKREIDVGVELDEIDIEELPSEKGEEEEEIKREGSDTTVLDEDKVEILPSVEGQAAATTRYIDFHGGNDQESNVALSTCGDEVVAEKRDVTEQNVNILISDFGDVYHSENDEIDIVNISVESVDRSQAAELLRPCKNECLSTDDVICEASTSFSDFLDKSDYEPRPTGTIQNHDDMKVDITEPEQSDVALTHESNEVDRERIPAPPHSEDSLSHLHNEMPLLERLGSESSETLDGSIGNELDGGEEVAIIEELKSLLEYERNALHTLYAELDEERNASAVATNQTMAMINRLQEEKATIEMEALQYQRMMEEQSEYDQEALQLMNEMLIKREKELQELEKELEVCRKKLMDYKERERMRLLSQGKDGSCTRGRNSSASCSNGEESDEVSVDLNNESREEDGYCKCKENGHHHNTPVDAIMDVQQSLSSFEEERMSILEQLKVLEEKLCSLAEEEEHHIENMKPFEQFYEENATEFDRKFKLNGGVNGLDNGTFAINKKHHEGGRLNGSKPRQLLPLFDAAELESDSELSNGVEDGLEPLATHKPFPTKYELEKKRLSIEEEVDHVYERLHALEADREFVKHCIGSLRKGDKGVHLLQEILQHLRDLKNVELQARNICGGC